VTVYRRREAPGVGVDQSFRHAETFPVGIVDRLDEIIQFDFAHREGQDLPVKRGFRFPLGPRQAIVGPMRYNESVSVGQRPN
jgi:hypothetical protein